MKKLPAMIAAFVTTAVLALLMLAVGVNAFMNQNTVQVVDTPGQSVDGSTAISPVSANSNDPKAQVQQLQGLVAQYQAREKQYQDREKQLQSQITQLKQSVQNANTQAQQYQNLVEQLQQMGVIRVDQNGQITIPRFGRGVRGSSDDHD